VNRFAEQAQSLLDAALAAIERREDCQEMTVLIGREGGIQVCADSDWPLDSLMLDRGARTGYRVSPRRGSVRVEGREGLRRCVLEGSTANLGLPTNFRADQLRQTPLARCAEIRGLSQVCQRNYS